MFTVSACFAQISIAVGGSHHSVISGPSGVCGWGRNGNGEIGDGTTTNPRTTPVAVSITSTVTKVIAGKTTTLFLKSNGTVWGCGYNEAGQLGQGNLTQQNTPIQIMAGFTFTDIACGTDQDHCLLLRNDNKVYAFGRNTDGELGCAVDPLSDYTSTSTFFHPCTNATGSSPNCEWDATYAPSIGGANCLAIWAGAYQSFFKKTDGTIWACGENTVGQLGNGTTTDQYIPVSIGTFAANTVSKISAGPTHALFLKTDGTVWATGWNNNYELGDGTNTLRSTPIQCTALPGGSTWIDIAAGGSYSLFLRNDGTVWVVGGNLYGALGNGAAFPTSTVTTPTQIGLTNITKIAAGSHGQTISLFLKSDNTLWSAGYNVNGQLGDGTTTPLSPFGKSTPVQVSTGSGCLPSILPVELLSFNASCENGIVVCKWSTASEINNNYFSVERSENGTTFTEIGTVKGAANSSTKTNYEFTDELSNPFIHQSVVYYRLKQTDYDGRQDYYGPISVDCSPFGEWNFILQSIPAKDELLGTIFTPGEEKFQIDIHDLQGRVILSDKFTTDKGSNLIKFDIKNIDSGMYFVKVYNEKRKFAKKFVKM